MRRKVTTCTMISENKPTSPLRSLTSRARFAIQAILLLDIVGLLVASGLGTMVNIQPTDLIDPDNAYSTGKITLSLNGTSYFAVTLFLVFSSIIVVAYLSDVKSYKEEERRFATWGNWWLLLIIPAVFGNYFDGFAGHILFIVIFIAVAYLFYSSRENAWKWGAALGIFIAVFYARDATGDLIRGGPWNLSGVTLSSVNVTHTLWGLLAFTSDMMVVMFLLPLVYNMFRARKGILTIFLGVSMFLVIIPSLVLLPLVGFTVVFSGWVSYVSIVGSVLSLAAIPLVFTAKIPQLTS